MRRWGFFTRVLDEGTPSDRYRLATEQIAHAERFGFHSAWVAQHHFHEAEGGLPSPFVFLAHAAARAPRIRLGTGIVTLPLEAPIRVAEDAAVLDTLIEGRLELGVGTGGNPTAFAAFGLDSDARSRIFADNLAVLRTALAGGALCGGDSLYPTRPELDRRIWQATFSIAGGTRAGQAGDGLLLSRTQPRAKDVPWLTLAEIQQPIIDAYLAALLPGCTPRILGSRTVFVADCRAEALRLAETGLRRYAERLIASGQHLPGHTLADIIKGTDTHLGTPEDVIASLESDSTLEHVTDLAVQVHSIDPPHSAILRSLELVATEVAPILDAVRNR